MSTGDLGEWVDETLRAAGRKRKEELGRLLMEDVEPSDIDETMAEPGRAEYHAGRDQSKVPEFVEHECWRLLIVWPDETDPTLPGRIECRGCGAVGRFELEYKP